MFDTVWLLSPFLGRERTAGILGILKQSGRVLTWEKEELTSHDRTQKHDHLGKGSMYSSSFNLVFMKLKISQKCGSW